MPGRSSRFLRFSRLLASWWIVASCGSQTVGALGDVDLAPRSPVVMVDRLGQEVTIAFEALNHADDTRTVEIEHVSCGCMKATEARAVLPGRGAGSLRVVARPVLLNPETYEVRFRCLETARVVVLPVRIGARSGVHVQPATVTLSSHVVGEAVRVGELSVSVPAGRRPVGPRCIVQPRQDAIEVVLDNPRLKRDADGIGVYVFDVFVVGRTAIPPMVHRCIFESEPPDAATAQLTLTAGFHAR